MSIDVSGHYNFRGKVALSLISKKRIVIDKIRHKSEQLGINDAEVTLLKLADNLSNGAIINTNDTGTRVIINPGTLIGGSFSLQCPNSRGLGYYVEFLLMLAPFCKSPINAELFGVTNINLDPSVDLIIKSWLPVYRLFVGPAAASAISIDLKKRGVYPNGGGHILFQSKPADKILAIDKVDVGKVYRIRGISWSCRVNRSYGHNMITGAKSILNKFLSDVYIAIDHRKGEYAGKSPGFGITLVAESHSGASYTAEAICDLDGTLSLDAESVGKLAASRLLDQIYQNGFIESSAQSLAFILMASESGRNASRLAIGNPTDYSINTLRLIRDIMGVTFYFKYVDKLSSSVDNSSETEKESKENSKSEILVAICFGLGLQNYNKSIR